MHVDVLPRSTTISVQCRSTPSATRSTLPAAELPASTSISRDGSYSLGVKLGLKGKNDLRIVSGTTTSPVFNVTVR